MNSKKIIFSLVAILLPLAFLALVELGLWTFDAYAQPQLFLEIEENDATFTQINSQVGERYFNKNIMPVPNLYPQKFPAKKPSGTMRIFCLGGSTTAGFPYEMTVPFPQQLALLLAAEYPGRDFEVINMGLSAINTFTLVDWMPDILEQEPDLIILYAGHNEFYGAYGTGSSISLGNDGRFVRLLLKLQKFRIVQLINALVRESTDIPPGPASPTLMEKVIADRFIETNSVLRLKTRENFDANMDIILNSCRSAEVPIILSNLVSNLKDQVPLDMTSNPDQASSKAHKLYLKGLREFKQGDTTTAYISLTRAKNKDQVPFRGDDYINEILQVKAGQGQHGIVDMKSVFKRASVAGIPGNDLFSDHLHPNPRGYHLMAREFQKVMVKQGLLKKNDAAPLPAKPLLVTALDWEIGALRVFKLSHRWPFGNRQVDYSAYLPLYDEKTVEVAKHYLFDHSVWGKAHSEMADYYHMQGNLIRSCEEYLAIIEMYPEKTEFYAKLVERAKQATLWKLVENTCQRALLTTDSKGMFYYNQAIAQRMTGDINSALINIKAAIMAPEISKVQSDNCRYTYAMLLAESNKPMEAKIVLDDLIRESPGYQNAGELLSKLNEMLN